MFPNFSICSECHISSLLTIKTIIKTNVSRIAPHFILWNQKYKEKVRVVLLIVTSVSEFRCRFKTVCIHFLYCIQARQRAENFSRQSGTFLKFLNFARFEIFPIAMSPIGNSQAQCLRKFLYWFGKKFTYRIYEFW